MNHKIDCGFTFSLNKYQKNNESAINVIKDIYLAKAEIKPTQIDEIELKRILKKWLFSFLEEEGGFGTGSYLYDGSNNFSLSDNADRISFVEEFLYHLLNAVKPINTFLIVNIDSKYYLGYAYSIICFETRESIYVLNLSCSD